MKKKIKICLLWHNLQSSNYGVGALTFQQIVDIVRILDEKNIKKNDVEFISFGTRGNSFVSYDNLLKNITIKHIHLSIPNLFKYFFYKPKFDFLFDIGEGDSFSDIYGLKRFYYLVVSKFLFRANYSVLSPQKFGPFYNKSSEIISRFIIKRSNFVFTRDIISHDFLNKKNIKNSLVPDIAFNLPFIRRRRHKNSVGINISGLLWNQQNLSSNISISGYKELCLDLIDNLLIDNNKVYLISHVINDEGRAVIDDDITFNRNFKNNFYPNNNNVILVENCKNPIEVKSFISSLNFIFVSRMHAAIAAFSTNTPFIALGYSSKYIGTFKLIKYNYVYNLLETNLNSKKLYSLFSHNYDDIKLNLLESKKILIQYQSNYAKSLKEIFNE